MFLCASLRHFINHLNRGSTGNVHQYEYFYIFIAYKYVYLVLLCSGCTQKLYAQMLSVCFRRRVFLSGVAKEKAEGVRSSVTDLVINLSD